MTIADDLRLLVTGYSEMVVNLDIMLGRLDAELSALAAEISTITDGAMAGARSSHLSRLEAKRVALGFGFTSVYTWGTYGTDNISDDWAIWRYNVGPWTGNITRINTNSFRHDGMSFPTYVTEEPVLCNNVARVVNSVIYTPPEPGPDPPMAPGSIIVNLQTGTALPSPLNEIYGSYFGYEYNGAGWDSDAGIIADQFAFALGHDQINADIDLNGTYGLNARVSNITTGRDVQILNRNKYQDFVDYYEAYAAP
jgi:hypothetical protein